MHYKDRNPESYKRFRSQMEAMLAIAGVSGVLEILADITQEYGDGTLIEKSQQSRIPIDHAFFLTASAQIDQVRENLGQGCD